MTVFDAINRYLDYRQELTDLRQIAATTHQAQAHILQIWQSHIGDIELDAVRKSHLDIALARMGQTRSSVTLSVDRCVIRTFFLWAVDERLIDEPPRIPVVRSEFTEEDLPGDEAFRYVMLNLPERHSKALEFMMLTGIAPHEMERCQPIDMDAKRTKHGSLGVGIRPSFHVKQSTRRRWIPLSTRARDIWDDMTDGMEADAAIFPKTDAIQKAIWRVKQKPGNRPKGVGQITPKWARKWFGSRVASQQPEHVMQRLMGHAPGSKVTRRHYTRASERQMTEATSNLEIGK